MNKSLAMVETTEWLSKAKTQLEQAATAESGLIDEDGFKAALKPADVSELK